MRALLVPFVVLASCRFGAEPVVPVSTVLPVDPGEILVVDLKDQEQIRLEAHMRPDAGVVVVSYDPSPGAAAPLRILDCKLDGAYGFMGTTVHDRVLKLDSGNETSANLPFSAFSINNQLGAKFFAQNELDVAVKYVGIYSTARDGVTKDELTGGDCAAATHFVKSTTVGAFTIAENNKSENDYTVHVWELAADHQDHAIKDVNWSGGKPGACDAEKPGDPQPVDDCGVPVFAELQKLLPPGQKPPPKELPAVAVDDEPCPTGDVRKVAKDAKGAYALGECTDQRASLHVCAMQDLGDCTAQCNAGEPYSCGKLGFMWHYGGGVPSVDLDKAHALYARACDGGAMFGCAGLGVLAENASPPDPRLASGLLEKACDAGNARGCQALGALVGNDKNAPAVKVDPARAFALEQRACSGGDAPGCFDEGLLLENGKGAAQDQPQALVLYRLSCGAGFAHACSRVGLFYLYGAAGLGSDPSAKETGKHFLDLGCRGGHQQACEALGLVNAGKPLPQDL